MFTSFRFSNELVQWFGKEETALVTEQHAVISAAGGVPTKPVLAYLEQHLPPATFAAAQPLLKKLEGGRASWASTLFGILEMHLPPVAFKELKGAYEAMRDAAASTDDPEGKEAKEAVEKVVREGESAAVKAYLKNHLPPRTYAVAEKRLGELEPGSGPNGWASILVDILKELLPPVAFKAAGLDLVAKDADDADHWENLLFSYFRDHLPPATFRVVQSVLPIQPDSSGKLAVVEERHEKDILVLHSGATLFDRAPNKALVQSNTVVAHIEVKTTLTQAHLDDGAEQVSSHTHSAQAAMSVSGGLQFHRDGHPVRAIVAMRIRADVFEELIAEKVSRSPIVDEGVDLIVAVEQHCVLVRKRRDDVQQMAWHRVDGPGLGLLILDAALNARGAEIVAPDAKAFGIMDAPKAASLCNSWSSTLEFIEERCPTPDDKICFLLHTCVEAVRDKWEITDQNKKDLENVFANIKKGSSPCKGAADAVLLTVREKIFHLRSSTFGVGREDALLNGTFKGASGKVSLVAAAAVDPEVCEFARGQLAYMLSNFQKITAMEEKPRTMMLLKMKEMGDACARFDPKLKLVATVARWVAGDLPDLGVARALDFAGCVFAKDSTQASLSRAFQAVVLVGQGDQLDDGKFVHVVDAQGFVLLYLLISSTFSSDPQPPRPTPQQRAALSSAIAKIKTSQVPATAFPKNDLASWGVRFRGERLLVLMACGNVV